ncbi:MAG: rhodanese-like domain-containing protein [Fluviicola sp.]|nr:rhodanese-like domain-containing protein [Fluviicola sp.]
MQLISPKDTESRISNGENISILDVRECYEHDICSIDAIHIPMAEISARLDELPKERSIVVMCKTGKRAEAIANFLETEMNFKDTFILEGGIMAWIEQIDPNLEKY